VANRRAVINADAPKFGLAAKADIATQAPYPATVEIRAEKTDLASLPVDLGEPLTGTVTAVVRGTGDLDNPAAGQATAEVSSANVEWRGQPIQTEGPLRARYENRMLAVDQATILARDSRVSLSGTLPLDTTAGDGAINLSAKLDLASLADYIPADQPVTAQGIATIEGSIRGNLKRIDPNLTVAVDNGYISAANLDPPLSNIAVRAEIRDGAVELRSASTHMGPATITASGTVPFGLLPADLPIELPRRQGPAQFTAELKTLELDTLDAVPDDIRGTISARLEVQAPRPEPEAIVGKLTFPDFRVAVGAYSLEQKGRPEILIQNGTVRVDEFLLTGPTTEVRLAGTAGFTGDRPLNVKLDGNLDASVVSAFSEAIRASGPTEIHLAVTGNMAQPQARGTVQLADAQVSVETPRIGIDNLNARLDLDGRRLTISQLTGSLNGGTLSGQGSAEYTNGQLQNTNLAVKADEVFLDFPQGLKTVSNIALNLQNTANEGLVLGGQVSITEGGFTDDLNIERGVLAALTAPRGIEVTKDRNPMLEKLALSVGVRTESPIIVDNNLAEAEISADLRVVGNPYDTGLSGRLIIEEGGQLRLQEREYIIERGVITFANERRIVPSLDVLATTRAGGYDIRLQISGEPGKTQTTLTSDPELPEPDILAVLVTGKTMEQMRGEEFTVASNQVLSYLAGRVGSTLGRGIESATGISTVRIEPTLIAAEADPSARLTVGQNITRNLQLIYSMDLVDSSDQIYVAEYELSRRFTTNAIRQSDGSFRLEFRHDLRFGGIPEPRRGARREHRRIGNISILGDPLILPEPKIADKLNIEQGDRYDFFKIRRGVDRISQLYAKSDLLEARVRMNREQRDSTVDLSLNVAAGPKVEFVFEGISPKAAGEDRVREVWRSGVFDVQRAEDSVEAIKERLVKEDYLQPKIKYSISTPAPDLKRVLFDIQPGPKYSHVEWAFPGAKGIEPGDLRKVIKQQKLSTEVYTKPGRVTELLARFYQEHGYLDAEVSDPQYELNPQGGSGKVIFEVTEGPLFRIAKVAFEGNNAFPDARLAEAVPLPTGEPYRPILREHALQRLRDLYWEQGYNDVEAEMVLARSEESGTADITFQITENKQAIVREILIEGNQNTSENMIRTQLEVTPGAALNLQKLADSRRNLYFTGAYSIVDIVREDITGAETNGNDKPVRLRVKVREVQPFELRYGGYFDTERGPGAIVDISNRNSLGSARVLGLRTRYDKQLQEARLYFSQPLLKRFPLKTIVSPFVRYERNPATPDADPFNVDRVGFSIQQETTFWEKFLLNYGYRIERSRTYDPGPEAFFDIPLRIASLTSSLSRDTRDELLDASRGSFISHAIQYSPEALGSELRFIKYLGQYFKYIPLQKPRIELFTNKVMRPRLVYAGGIRVGLATGLGGQEVPLSERFLAGGATTIRGFEQNSIGPTAGRVQLGGEAMLVINNELRVPLFSIFDGVGFVDVGNVYRTVSDFSFGDIRKTAGVGLRARTPWFLLRLDYGFKLDRRTGESSGRLYFSIGQAF
jgi:outer membrane protein assembly complex protein YaeT